MAEEYSIRLGTEIDLSDIQGQIDTETGRIKPKIKVDVDAADLAKKVKAELEKVLGKSDATLKIDTVNIESSLREVSECIKGIKDSLGTLDSGKGMKSLLSSINQIADSLGKATDESEALVKTLNSIAKKDLNLNIGVNMGGKSFNNIAYGREARKYVLPQLEQQIEALEGLFGGKDKAVSKLMGANIGFDVFTDFNDFNSDTAIRRMEAYEKYINSLKKLANMSGVDLSGFDKEFSKSAHDLIDEVTGVKQATDVAEEQMNKLKGIFGSGIDADKISTQLDSIVVDLNEIKTALQGLSSGVTLDGLTQGFDKLSQTLERLMSNVTIVQNGLGNGFSGSNVDGITNGISNVSNSLTDIENKLRKINNINIDFNTDKLSDDSELEGVRTNIEKLKMSLKDFGFDKSSINSITKDFDNLNVSVKKVTSSLNNDGTINLTVTGTDNLDRTVTAIKKISYNAEDARYDIEDLGVKVSQSFNKIANEANKIKDKLKFNDDGFSDYEREIRSVESSFNRLSNQSNDLKDDIKGLRTILSNIVDADAKGDINALVDANRNYEEALKGVNNQLQINRRAEQDAKAASKLVQDRTNLSLNMDNWLKDNSAAAKQFGGRIRELQAELKYCDNVRLGGIRGEFTKIKKEAELAGKTTKTLGDRLKDQFAKYSSYLSIASVFMYGEQALRDMFEQVKAIDSAMTELKKVTDETDAAYDRFLTNAASKAKEIGTTIDGLVASTADFARLGYGFEDAQGLAEVANIYAVVGDEVEGVEGATQSLISTMAAFKHEMNGLSNTDFSMSIIDKMNEVGNNFAISSGGLGQALQRSASSMAAANNSLDETIAIITAANTVVQNPEKIGRLCRFKKWLYRLNSRDGQDRGKTL